MTAYHVSHTNAQKTLRLHHSITCEDRRARSKAMDLGSIPVGVRRFESGSSHQFWGELVSGKIAALTPEILK